MHVRKRLRRLIYEFHVCRTSLDFSRQVLWMSLNIDLCLDFSRRVLCEIQVCLGIYL